MRYVALATLLLTACGMPAGGVSGLPQTASQTIVSARTQHEHVIYNFLGASDGASPQGTLIANSSGVLYGTTTYGGVYGCTFNAGCGTVFKLTPKQGAGYVHAVLYAFKGGSDGEGPGSGVISDTSGGLYGTTEYGGSAGDGMVFKLTASGSSYSESVLHTFAGGKDGNGPLGGLTMDAAGNLFGATLLGGGGTKCQTGAGCGVIFELKRSGSTYTEQILYRFSGGADGATPDFPPVFVGHDLYGTSATGGGSSACGGAPINPGCGTIYELELHRGKYKFHVVYHFTGEPGDAANAFAGLTRGRNGTLYGLGQYGGANNVGAAFALSRSGKHYTERLVHSFTGTSDGSYPLAALALGSDDALYGATQYGGSANDGTVFKLKPSGSETVLLTLEGGAAGGYPAGGILVGAGGTLFGTASYGGSGSLAAGIAFRL